MELIKGKILKNGNNYSIMDNCWLVRETDDCIEGCCCDEEDIQHVTGFIYSKSAGYAFVPDEIPPVETYPLENCEIVLQAGVKGTNYTVLGSKYKGLFPVISKEGYFYWAKSYEKTQPKLTVKEVIDMINDIDINLGNTQASIDSLTLLQNIKNIISRRGVETGEEGEK